MGWWSPPENPDICLGDEVMDETYSYLGRLTELYRQAFERKPTLAELEMGLGLALRISGEACFDDLTEDRQVESVTIKMARRPKRQKYQVGDIFLVTLHRGWYMFGRIINLADGWNLVEIFSHVSKTPKYSPDILQSDRLLPPLWINPQQLFAEWKWKIIHSTPGYRAPDLDSLKYVRGTPGNYEWIKVNDFAPRGRIPDKEAETLPKREMLPLEAALEEIEEAARKKKLF